MVKLKGSTIIESLIAMTILVSIIAIAILFTESMLRGPVNIQKWRAQLAIEGIATITKEKNLFHNERIDSLDFLVEKRILPFSEGDNLYFLEIIALDQNNVEIAKYQEVVKIR